MTFTCAPSLRASSEAIRHNNQSLRASAKQSTTIISHCERQAKQSVTYSTQPFICQRLLHDFVVRNDCHTQPVIASVSEAIHHNNQSLRAKRSNLSLIQHNLSYVRDCFENSFLAMTFTSAPSLRAKRSNPSLTNHNLSYVRDCFETSFLAMTFTCAPSLRASSEAICL